jgi:hypothetical protein
VARALPFSRSRRPNCKVGRYEAPPLPAALDRRRPYGIVDRMEYGRLVKVVPPHGARNVEPVVYVVAAEDPNEAMKLVAGFGYGSSRPRAASVIGCPKPQTRRNRSRMTGG